MKLTITHYGNKQPVSSLQQEAHLETVDGQTVLKTFEKFLSPLKSGTGNYEPVLKERPVTGFKTGFNGSVITIDCGNGYFYTDILSSRLQELKSRFPTG